VCVVTPGGPLALLRSWHCIMEEDLLRPFVFTPTLLLIVANLCVCANHGTCLSTSFCDRTDVLDLKAAGKFPFGGFSPLGTGQ